MNMVEADPTGRGSMNRKATGKRRKTTPLQPLLSSERSQKLDLLLHLISNIPEGLVVCGPLGIGKSTILDLVQAASPDTWSVCRMNASSTTHFDDIQAILVESVSGGSGATLKIPVRNNLSDYLGRFRRDERFLVLLIDDAGEMAPGVLTEVCHFADSNPALRPVFTMTADRLHLMSSSDPAVGNCQVIEVPPLSEIQCGGFLRNLSGKPGAVVSMKAITPLLIQQVYRESHGVPGNMLSILSRRSTGHVLKVPGTSLPIYAGITLVVAIGIGYLLWSTTGNSSLSAQNTVLSGSEVPGGEAVVDPIDAEQVPTEFFIPPGPLTPPFASPNVALEKEIFPGVGKAPGAGASESVIVSESPSFQVLSGDNRADGNPVSSPAISSVDSADVERVVEVESPTGDSSEQQPGSQAPLGESSDNSVDAKITEGVLQPDKKVGAVSKRFEKPSDNQQVNTEVRVIGTAESKKKNVLAESELAQSNDAIVGIRDDRWIRKQNPQRFTLQLLAVKKFDAMNNFIHSHSQLEDLAVFKTHKKGANWYALIQGVYPSLSAAKEAAKKLPSGLRKAWPRKFKSVQSGMIDFDAE